MPFVQRVVQPVQLSRVLLHDEQGRPRVKDGELEAVTNHTLSSALRQLASVVLLADEIFQDLGKILGDVTERSKRLRVRIAAVDQRVSEFDPKAVTVPESDLTIFSSRKEHFSRSQCVEKGLFTPGSRPVALRRLYEAAAATPLPVVRQLDRYRRDGLRSSRFFAVTPVLAGGRRRTRQATKVDDIDIETRTPAVVSKLRMWTSLEALGDVTVDPDCTHKIDASVGNDDVDHRLPSPEEQVQAIALKFPAEIVKVDVSGRSFNRMSAFRRSLMHVESGDDTRRRGNKSRRSRSKRRNTIAGTDTKELAAIVCDSSDTNFGKSTPDSVACGATVIGGSAEKKSHLESLKEWGRSRLRLIKNSEPAVRLRERSLSSRRKWADKETGEPHPHSSSGNWSASSESGQSTATSHHPRSSISSGSTCQKHGRRTVMVSTSSSVTSESTLTPDDGETCSMYSCDTEGYYTSFHMDSGLKTLREEDPMPALQSTSALSASRLNSSSLTADSEYELFGKGSTSTTASSAGTVCTTLIIPPPSVPERVNSHLSTERSVKSLTNLTSDKTPPHNKDSPYYKSNTDPCRGRSVSDARKIEPPVKSNLTKENVSKLKEQYNDNVQPDKNCMIMVEVHHEGDDDKNEKCGDSPDSGHNTCSSPVDSVTSPSLDLEMSECSDLEGVDRVERIRVKTTINSSRIPSMCVITPPQSDDEVSLSAMKTAPVDIGDYVTIADVRKPSSAAPTPVPTSPVLTRESEYVSLNELPTNDSLERKRRQGARVTLDSEGKVVYSSDSLRRRKAIHTTGTFDPGPNIAKTSSPVMQHRVVNIRPVVTSNSPILRGERRLASVTTLTPTTQKIIAASQQIISRPLSPLVGNKKIIVNESTTSTLLSSKTDTLKKVDNTSVIPNNNQTNTGLVTVAAQRRTSPSNQKQYFPKSSYGNMSPVATSNRPMSPLVLASSPKITNISNGRRSQTPPTSPVKSPTLSSRPLSPKNVVKASPNRAVSPTSPRGAYVRVKDADDDSKTVKRSDSYRMANDQTKTVFNPNVLGRKQYGAGIVAGPKLLTAIQSVQTNKESKTREEGSSREEEDGASSPPRQWQDTWPQRHVTPQSEVRSSTPTKPNTPPMNITTTLSPIRSSTPTRSPMDLYAIIHQSKKKIMKLKGKQSPEPAETPTSSGSSSKQVNWPKCIPTAQLKGSNVLDQSHEQVRIPFNGQYQRLSASPTPSPLYTDRQGGVVGGSYTLPRKLSSSSPPTKIENISRYSPPNRSHLSPPQPMPNLPTRNYASLDRKFSPKANFRQPIPNNSSRLGLSHSTSRNDFKQLLLRTGWSASSPGKPSAVERLKNSKPAVPAVPSPKRKTWKSDVLSSTILEDCDEADGQSQREVNAILQAASARDRLAATIPKSSALVSQQCKEFQARSSPTLETAL